MRLAAIILVVLGIIFIAGATPCLADHSIALILISEHPKGAAECSTDGTTWKKLKKGDTIEPGSIICTSNDGNVDIQFKEWIEGGKANALHVYPSTILKFKKVEGENHWSWRSMSLERRATNVDIELRQGMIMCTVRKDFPMASYEVRIPNHVAKLFYGPYIIGASGKIYTSSGPASVMGEGGTVEGKVSAGYYYDCKSGKTEPLTPQQLQVFLFSCHSPFEYPPQIYRPFHGPGMGGSLREF